MTEEQLVSAFEEATQLHANEATERGLHPVHVANVLMVASLRIVVQIDGVEGARAGLLRAAAELA